MIPKKAASERKRIFLIDAIGAFVSAFLLGVVLPAIQEWVGMPKHVLYILSFWALIAMVFSFSCFWFADHSKAVWLRAVLVANVFYCLVTIFFMTMFCSILTLWGWTYFLIELMMILGLVWRENKIIQRSSSD